MWLTIAGGEPALQAAPKPKALLSGLVSRRRLCCDLPSLITRASPAHAQRQREREDQQTGGTGRLCALTRDARRRDSPLHRQPQQSVGFSASRDGARVATHCTRLDDWCTASPPLQHALLSIRKVPPSALAAASLQHSSQSVSAMSTAAQHPKGPPSYADAAKGEQPADERKQPAEAPTSNESTPADQQEAKDGVNEPAAQQDVGEAQSSWPSARVMLTGAIMIAGGALAFTAARKAGRSDAVVAGAMTVGSAGGAASGAAYVDYQEYRTVMMVS